MTVLPEPVMAPTEASPPVLPSTVQVTDVSVVPDTVAVRLTGARGARVALVGVTVSWTWPEGLAAADWELPPPPPQPVAIPVTPRAARAKAAVKKLFLPVWEKPRPRERVCMNVNIELLCLACYGQQDARRPDLFLSQSDAALGLPGAWLAMTIDAVIHQGK